MPKLAPPGVHPPPTPERPAEAGEPKREPALPALKGFDAIEASREVPEPGSDPQRQGGTVPLFLGAGVANLGRAVLVTATKPVEPDRSTETGRLRLATLARLATDGAAIPRYEERRSEHAVHGGGGAFFPAGPLGYGYVAGRYTKGISIKTVALMRGHDDEAARMVPSTAVDLRAMWPGESVAITGESKTKLFGGNLKCHLDEDLFDGSWVAGGPFGVEVGIDHQGITTTEVLRGEADAARVLLREENERAFESSGGIHIGFYLSWGLTAAYEITRRLKGSAEAATEMATMPVWREQTSGVFVGSGEGEGRRCLVDIRLDLSRPAARRAYDAAMRGDLNVARLAAAEPDSGVEIPFSSETEIRTSVIPISLGLFGFGAEWEKSNESRTTKARLRGRIFEQWREIDGKSRTVTDLTLRRASQSVLADHAEVSSPTGEVLPQDMATERAHVEWTSAARDRTTGREEILGEIDLVAEILGDRAPPELAAYREKVAALPNHRFGWIGPRNEAGSTQVELKVRLATFALQRLATVGDDAIYAALGRHTAMAKGKTELPEWIDIGNRAAYDRESTDGHLEWKELSPRYLVRRQEYFEARRFVRTLQALAPKGPEARAKGVRDLIGTGGDSRRNLGVLAQLLTPDAIAIDLVVDSDRGDDGKELDFALKHVGEFLPVDAFDEQKQGRYLGPPTTT